MMKETADKPEQSRKEHCGMEQQGVKSVLVYGATGAQVSPVARRLLEDGFGVRVLTRDLGSPGAQGLREAGAEVVVGDMRDAGSLGAASEGMDGVFLLVPFLLKDPDDFALFGRNAIVAAKEARVRLLVWNPTGEIPPARTGLPAIDGRIEVLESLQSSGVPHVVLQPTVYMENYLGPWTAPEVAEKGVFTYPIPIELKMQWITHEDAAAFAVEALKRPEVADTNLRVCGPERLSGEEIAKRFGHALGHKISFRSMPPRQFGAHMDAAFGPGVGDGAVAAYEAAFQDPGMFSTDIDLSVALERLPIRPTPLEEWVRQHAAAFTARTGALSA